MNGFLGAVFPERQGRRNSFVDFATRKHVAQAGNEFFVRAAEF